MKKILTIACLFAFVAAASLTSGCYPCPCHKKNGKAMQYGSAAANQPQSSQEGDMQSPAPQIEGE